MSSASTFGHSSREAQLAVARRRAAAVKPKLGMLWIPSKAVWTRARHLGTLRCCLILGVPVMPYSGLMPSMEAIQQAVREPLLEAPHDHNGFAVYIFERAREIDHEWALSKKLAEQKRATRRYHRRGE